MCSTLFPPKISSWGGVHNSTGIDEGRKKLIILLAIKVKARTYRNVGRGEEGPLCDPGSELLLGGREGESSAGRINGMKKEKKKIPSLC